MPELLPMKVRAKVMGAAAMCTFLTSFVVASCFPTLLRAGAGFVFVMFACICVIASCFAAFVLRKTTTGLSLEEIEVEAQHHVLANEKERAGNDAVVIAKQNAAECTECINHLQTVAGRCR
ncbi:hypothetical protein P3T40_007494 [Paraburkholderia sp. EB58]|uniref:MFS transporter n=1 Tax=Paraburkholderia sp. EB58 TaxID=3035125 RepID=UPI003D208D22